jgi:hypothetical protein
MDCKLRNWRIEDASDLAKALNNKKIMDNLRDGLPYPYTEKDAEYFITSMLSADSNSTYAFAITVDDKAIGSIGVFRKDNIHSRTAELGYYVSEQYWGNGIGTSAVTQICEYIFKNTDILRIFADPTITLGVESHDEGLRVWVRDTGAGVPPHLVPRFVIFMEDFPRTFIGIFYLPLQEGNAALSFWVNQRSCTSLQRGYQSRAAGSKGRRGAT